MTITFDQETGALEIKGKKIGQMTDRGGVVSVQLNFTYHANRDSWIKPLLCFATRLRESEQTEASPPLLSFEQDEDAVREWYPVKRTLVELVLKKKGYVWKFHKTDADGWPSRLHGHDYDRRLKVDAVDGGIYDSGTKTLCGRLRERDLNEMQKALRASKDFSTLAN